jgi:hypothetical protein
MASIAFFAVRVLDDTAGSTSSEKHDQTVMNSTMMRP